MKSRRSFLQFLGLGVAAAPVAARVVAQPAADPALSAVRIMANRRAELQAEIVARRAQMLKLLRDGHSVAIYDAGTTHILDRRFYAGSQWGA
jgi:hypothetical protein